MTTISIHKPVLLEPILDALDPKPGDIFVDGTLGGGGHAKAVLERLDETSYFIGIDQDNQAIESTSKTLEKYKPKKVFVHDNFANVPQIWITNHLPLATKVLVDLGWSSDQFADRERGFSFQIDGPLDMRLDNSKENSLTAKDLVNTLNKEQLASIIKNYGEERYAYRIAREISYHVMEFGEINTTKELVDIIKEAVPASYHRTKIHPATRTFQALRIAVNDELGVLERGLEAILSITDKNAIIGIISFHSLEDRIVKHTFKRWNKEGVGKIKTKKPITASNKEIKDNPRSRSAKLRIFIKKETT